MNLDVLQKKSMQKVEQVTKQFQETLQTGLKDLVEESKKEVVKTVETNKREREKSVIEEGIRNHLRGFSRTIPSFLMAYGNDKVTLATFDTVIPKQENRRNFPVSCLTRLCLMIL